MRVLLLCGALCRLAAASDDLQLDLPRQTDAVQQSDAAIPIATAEGLEFFETKIRPVLVEHCYSCHSAEAKKLKGGLRLDGPAEIRKGGDSGPILNPGKPADSPLLAAISYAGDVSEMPPQGKLSESVLADFRKWVEIGSPLPSGGDLAAPAPQTAIDIERGRGFWSFQPVRVHPLPAVSDPNWPRQRIDYFVLQKLDEKALRPTPAADRRSWLRRLSVDLIGLPPTYAEIEAFAADTAPDADQRAVDRLLASPHYGERWARHWLDVARYAEDNPTSESTCKPPRFPFRYRDWVIRAWNDDLPYADFVRRQLAADLMDVEPAEIAALGFLGLSPVYHKEPKLSKEVISVIVADEWDERLDTITRGFLGLTVACARCHDHKFDPITTQDYYALAGVVASTQLVEWPLVEAGREAASALTDVQLQIVDDTLRLDYAKKMKETAQGKGEDPQPFEKAAAELDAKLKNLKETQLFDGPIANAVRDAGLWINGDDPAWTLLDFEPGRPRDLPVFIRGSATNPGKIVPRRFLEVLSPAGAPPFQQGSGRRELADCLVNQAAPLTAPVIVNRVWGWHFGQPLIRTPSNFGKLGDPPSHPELLDDLAARFIEHGWSLKWLHREIVLSAAWGQAATHRAAAHEVDPDNRWLWRMNRRRLEAEAWRDMVLATTAQLDATAGGPSSDLDKLENRRRTVYGTISRQKSADLLRLFDFPDAKSHGEQRLLTTTPLQHLYLLNSPFLQQHAAALVAQILAQPHAEPTEIVQALFQSVLLRDPTRDEVTRALELVKDERAEITPENWTVLAHGLLASNEFLFVD
jgi:mono/diheme cytochrome c family protein